MNNNFSFIEKVNRPWGKYYVIHDQINYKLKRLEINPGQRLSYQFHKKRSETWVVISGSALITINGIEKKFSTGETIIIPVLAKHRIENKNNEVVILIEVQTGTYFGEDDITRLEDDYNRALND